MKSGDYFEIRSIHTFIFFHNLTVQSEDVNLRTTRKSPEMGI